MNNTYQNIINRYNDILALTKDEATSIYQLAKGLGLTGAFGLRQSCNVLIVAGYLEKINAHGLKNKPAVLYKALKQSYNGANIAADLKKAREEKVSRKPDTEELPAHHRRISVNKYHTSLRAPNEPRRSARTHVGISSIYNG